MITLTYVSSATELMDEPALVDLLEEVRPKNAALDITGMLLYHDGNIVQNLEGPDGAVVDVFATISADPRHRGVIELWREPAQERAFPDWSMAFRRLSDTELSSEATEGRSGFLDRDAGDPARDQVSSQAPALRLLRAFRDNLR